MTTIAPTGPLPLAQTQAALAVLTVVGGELPEALASLPAGTLVDAQLVAAAGKNAVQLLTDAGTVAVKLPPGLQLPADSQLTVQLGLQNGLPVFRLVAVNGRPLPGGPAAAIFNAPNGLMAGLLLATEPRTGVAPGSATGPAAAPNATAVAAAPAGGLAATVVRAAPVAGQAPAGAPPVAGPGQTPTAAPGAAPAPAGLPPALAGLPAGTVLTVRIAAVDTPPPPAGQPAAPEAAPTGAAAAEQPAPAAAQPASPSAPAQPRVATVAPAPAAPPPAAAGLQAPAGAAVAAPAPSPTAPAVLTGTVVGHPPGAPAVVETPAGLLSLPAATPLAPGTTLRLEVVAPPQPPPAAQPAAPEQPGLTDRGWPALQEAAEVLTATDPPAAEQLMRMVPQLGPRLAAGLALFSGALRLGEARVMPSESGVRGLDRAGRRDLADRLRKDFLQLSDDAARPLGDGSWRGLAMPFMAGGEIDRIQLYVRRPPDDDDGRKGGGGAEQRFILEVSLSQLGRLQLDGLVARDTRRFDLIVRTDRPLSEAMRRDIAGIFAESGQLTGTVGQVSFQSGRFVELPPAEAAGTRITV